MKPVIRIAGVFIFTLVALRPEIHAQFEINAEYRPRFEFRDSYRLLNEGSKAPSFFISHRSRLLFTYSTDEYKLVFSPQDVRVWGDEALANSTGVFGDEASLDVHQAFIEISLAKRSSLSIGRQELSYDSQRLLSTRNWNQHGISYDAVVLKTKLKEMNIHMGAAWNSLTANISDNYYPATRIKSLNYLWINREIGENAKLSFLHVSSGITKSDTSNTLYFKHTTGLYSEISNKLIESWANVYYQFGRNNSGKKVKAFLVDADIAFKIGKFRPGLGGSYLSGNKKIDGSENLFDILYGARHRYFGHIDYYKNMASHTKQGGLTDIYAYIRYKIKESVYIKNTTHYFMLSQTNSLTPTNRNLGVENELELEWKLNDWSSVKLAYLFYKATNSFKLLRGLSSTGISQYAFLEITFKPSLFKSTK